MRKFSYFISEHFPKEMGKRKKRRHLRGLRAREKKKRGFRPKKRRAKKSQLMDAEPPTDETELERLSKKAPFQSIKVPLKLVARNQRIIDTMASPRIYGFF